MEGKGETIIELSQHAVLKKVQTSSYYTGESRKVDMNQVDNATRIQTSEDDEDILGDFFAQAVNTLGQMLTRYWGSTSVQSKADTDNVGYTKVTFSSKTPANFMESQVAQLTDMLEDHAAYLVLRDWLAVMKPGEESFAAQKAMELEQGIRLLLSNRKKPVRA